MRIVQYVLTAGTPADPGRRAGGHPGGRLILRGHPGGRYALPRIIHNTLPGTGGGGIRREPQRGGREQGRCTNTSA
jgi:hypothetical protein